MSKFTRYMLEVAPPGEKAERFIKKNKKAFTARYGDKGKNVLYATAWKMFGKKESVNEAHSAGYKMPKRSNETEGNFEVKWATNKKGPIQVAKGFKTHTDAKDWLAAQQKDDKRIKGIVVNKDFKIDRKRKTRKEEVEQVDEISRKKLTRYVKGASDDLERKAHNLGKARGRGGDYPDPRGGDHELARQSGMDRLKRKVKNRKAGINRAVGKLAKEERKPYPPPGWKFKKSHHSTVAHDATKSYIEKSGYADDIKRDKPKNVIAYVARRKREEREKKTNEGYGGLSQAEYEKAKAKPQKMIKKSPPVTPMSTSRVIARALKRSKKPSQRLTSGFSEDNKEYAIGRIDFNNPKAGAVPIKKKKTPVKVKKKSDKENVEEEGMIGRTKPSRELNVSRDEKPYLAGKSSL